MIEWNPDNPADLGIWDDLGWTQPPPEKKAKSLKLKKKDTEHHFAETDGDNSRFLSPSKGLERVTRNRTAQRIRPCRRGGR